MKSKNLYNKLIKIFKKKGFKNIDLRQIIETKYVLRSAGENFRKLLFSFYDHNNKEYSLRPDLSLSSLIQFINSKEKFKKKIFYSGMVFRKSYSKDKRIIKNQIGFEIYNSFNQLKDDKEIIINSINIYKNITKKPGTIIISNFQIFSRIVKNLDIPKRWKERLIKYFWRRDYFNEILKRLESNSDIDETVVEVDKKVFKKMKKLNPNLVIAGRSIKEITNRFKMKLKDPRTSSGKKSVKIIKDYLKIECQINEAPKKLNKFFKKNKVNIFIDKNYFPINKNNVGNLKIKFSSSELPEVDFYNGLLFFIKTKKNNKEINLISGGRFDDLSVKLGLRKTPAVGAAINLQ